MPLPPLKDVLEALQLTVLPGAGGAGTEFIGVDSRGRIFSGASGRPGIVLHELFRPLF